MSKSEATTGNTKYRLKFIPEALAEWNELDGSVKEPLRKALRKRLEQPHMPGSELHGGLQNCIHQALPVWSLAVLTRTQAAVLGKSDYGLDSGFLVKKKYPPQLLAQSRGV